MDFRDLLQFFAGSIEDAPDRCAGAQQHQTWMAARPVSFQCSKWQTRPPWLEPCVREDVGFLLFGMVCCLRNHCCHLSTTG